MNELPFDQKNFIRELPEFFPAFLSELKAEGYIVTLVGGTVRDFFLEGALGSDWDMEVTHNTIAFNKNSWKDLGKKLGKFGKISFLPYDIIRIDNKSHQLELSPPRKEKFLDQSHHSNFEAEFDFKMDFKDAVKRRDFTINAMGIRFHSLKDLEFLDPLDGYTHLKNKMLVPCSEDFSKDPVRFLRALRFSQKLGFEFSSSLEEAIEKMDLSGITSNYLWSEMQKSGNPLKFLLNLIEDYERDDLRLPLGNEIVPRFEEIKKVLQDPQKLESWIVALNWCGIETEDFSRYFSMSPDGARRLGRWAASSLRFQSFLPEDFQGEFDELKDDKKFEEVFDWYFTTKQLMQKYPEMQILPMIEEFLPEWIHLFRFEAPKDVKHIDPPYRAKYQVWNLCQRL